MNPFISTIFLLFLVTPKYQVVISELILHESPVKQCHASTIVRLEDGTLLTAFFGGSYEGAKDVKIFGSRKINGHWSDPVALADGKINDSVTYPCWNPVLFRSGKGILYLFYKVGKNPREWFGMMKTSTDDGRTWSGAISLPEGFLGPIKNKPIEMADNKLLCPSSTETSSRWMVHMEIFNMASGQWTQVPVDPSTIFEAIQPTILVHSLNSFQILCRTRENVVASSFSKDSGHSWTKTDSIPLPNPNSGIDGVTLANGTHLLVYNPLISGKEWSNGRNKLNLASSSDGIHWKDILVLEDQPDGEYSYPAIIQTPDHRVHVTYTYNRINIKHLEIISK